MQLLPRSPLPLALPPPLCHIPSPSLESTGFHPPTWLQEMPALPSAVRKSPLRIKLKTRHGPGADTRLGRERKRRCFNLALRTSVAADHRPERTSQERQVPGPTGLARSAQVFTLDRLSAGRLVGQGRSSNSQGQLPLIPGVLLEMSLPHLGI